MVRSRPSAADRFPAISVRQPAADEIVRGKKRRDVRSRPSRFRGWILIHASQTFRRAELPTGAPEPERGKLLGIARLEDCVKEGDGWSYVWTKPQRFRVAVPCRGHYSIPFYVPASLVRGTPAARVKPGTLTPGRASG
ncbi:MAG: ASCH domain-containing protein [Acidobacteriota bacterium]|nr:ASCH domain-containing protein [Acidobacteriota bacterium]